ncbi:NAD(P)H-dependent glycerol-3-phosphate dehydrogenase [Phocea massiliensis]|uniref:Glycerol-3-phosphate dehydrogenase [NAD(P)+] n=1 Tax=uncultured Anaerotruncus sp. TaxID=905011 RepID=A0A6N2V5X2_9FIRM|nr:NAD(P)H-dependent glycerol-3-phosphate dehydrogenase [Merdimmobilis hominis]MCD4837075.1 NAD(P)H-dependent glycerol-3-phosphate dehydrogenase [Merdimmobilis hominis]PWL63606.1 MAG: NAD(P)H-dependent glycerol-3-phosphate dehydrogenase [Oscillospiraceae bacterium]
MARLMFLGAGGFGTALAVMAHRYGHQVTLWSYDPQQVEEIRQNKENAYLLPGVPVPEEIDVTNSLDALGEADLVFIATPSSAVREVAAKIRGKMRPDAVVVCGAKGLERDTLESLSQVLEESLLENPVVMFSGPSHAEEVSRGVPTTAVVASTDPEAARKVQDILSNSSLRLYVNDDVMGVELGGALKNVIALAVGIADGLGLGDNTKAALMTRGLTEIARLGVACGARPETFSGLSGVGDLIVTCTSVHSRNRRAGILIGSGWSPQGAVGEVDMTVEGYFSTKAAYELSRRLGVEMPIVTEIYKVLYEGKDPQQAIDELMSRPRRHESEGQWLGVEKRPETKEN